MSLLTFIKKLFDSKNDIEKPLTPKPICIPSGQGSQKLIDIDFEMNIQNSYPRLKQNVKNLPERDEKGRFKKKGTM